MAPMSTSEKLRLKNELSRVLKKQLSSSQRLVLQKLGIYCHESKTVNLDFDRLEDSLLWQLKRELRSMAGSSGEGKVETDPIGKDDEAAKKALRVALLKIRFAETISKTNGGGKSDPHQERERLIRVRREEEEQKKKKIREENELKRRRQQLINEQREAVRTAKIRKKEREEDELKRRRQEQINKERQAARMALELLEKSVEVEDNFKVMKEFEMLINGCAC